MLISSSPEGREQGQPNKDFTPGACCTKVELRDLGCLRKRGYQIDPGSFGCTNQIRSRRCSYIKPGKTFPGSQLSSAGLKVNLRFTDSEMERRCLSYVSPSYKQPIIKIYEFQLLILSNKREFSCR